MFDQIAYLLGNAAVACVAWFNQIMEATGVAGFWLGAVIIWFIYKTLLKPLFGSPGSDRSRKGAGNKKKEDGGG